MQAEDLIARGFWLFPCDGKIPKAAWSTEITQDLTTIRNWKHRHPGWGWGVPCGPSGFCVVDVDCGKVPEAEDALFTLQLEHGQLPPTLRVRTPSGGYHLYYRGATRSGANLLCRGVDIRSVGGMAVGPGSPGYVVTDDLPFADLPDWVAQIVGKPREQKEVEVDPNFVYDTDSAIFGAIKFLKAAPPAMMGVGGNDRIYLTAANVKDFGVSKDRAVQLMLEHWYPRCEPNNREESMARIAGNAFRYTVDPPGIADPALIFTEFIDPDGPSPSTDVKSSSLFIDAYELLTRKITIDYLVDQLIETPSTGLMFGESTAGKSFLGLSLGLSAATGTPWLDNDIVRTGPVFYLCGEGQKGIPRRIAAWLKHHGVTLTEGMLKVSRHRLELDTKSAEKVRLEVEAMSILYGRPSLVIIDTLARHLPGSSDENSAKDIGAFINAVDYLKDALRCVMLIIHHSGKKALEVGRGSSALKAAMDFEIQVRPGVVTYTKQKDGELPEPFGFDLIDVELDFGLKSAVAIPSALDPSVRTLKLSKTERMAFDCLRVLLSSEGGQVTKDAWKVDFCANSTGKNKDSKERSFYRAVTKLGQAKAIVVEGDMVRLNDAGSED